jgi:hypothetical protein
MTAIIILLVLILLCMFKTVRIFIGIFLLLVWWNWPQAENTAAQAPSASAIEQPAVEPEPAPPAVQPEPALPAVRKPRPYIQQ